MSDVNLIKLTPEELHVSLRWMVSVMAEALDDANFEDKACSIANDIKLLLLRRGVTVLEGTLALMLVLILILQDTTKSETVQ